MTAKKRAQKKRAAKKPARKRAPRKPKVVPANDDGPREAALLTSTDVLVADADNRSPFWRAIDWLFKF